MQRFRREEGESGGVFQMWAYFYMMWLRGGGSATVLDGLARWRFGEAPVRGSPQTKRGRFVKFRAYGRVGGCSEQKWIFERGKIVEERGEGMSDRED